MAKIIGKKAKWTASAGVGVVSHKLYICKDTETMDYNTANATVLLPACEYVLPGVFSMGTKGNYKMTLSAVDDQGNESDQVPNPPNTSFFSFVAPSVPSGLTVVSL